VSHPAAGGGGSIGGDTVAPPSGQCAYHRSGSALSAASRGSGAGAAVAVFCQCRRAGTCPIIVLISRLTSTSGLTDAGAQSASHAACSAELGTHDNELQCGLPVCCRRVVPFAMGPEAAVALGLGRGVLCTQPSAKVHRRRLQAWVVVHMVWHIG